MLNKIYFQIKKLFEIRPPLEMSFSRISAYQFCPWKFKLVYRARMKAPPTPQISLRLTVHRALEEFHKGDGKTLDELLDVYDRVWVNEGFTDPQQTVHYYEKGEKMLNNYFDWFTLRKSQIVAVEEEFRFPVGRRILRGIIDRIDKLPDDTYEVIDYKTHAEMWKQDKIDSDLQITFYAMGCEQIVKAAPAALSYYFLAHNKVVTTTRSQHQIQEAILELEEVAGKIEKDDFTPNIQNCSRCDFKMTCKFSTVKRPEN
jgi:RecB family exonuclease